MNKKEYYVYGLIDPRNNKYFYIGKGKGKRFVSHLKPKRLDFNYAKLEKIKEIQKSGLEVKIEILFPNLDEDTAFELEKIVIYKLGRAVFAEGILTNLNPGGKWKPGDTVFYPKDFDPNFDINKLDFVSREKFNEIPKLSEFNYLNTANKEQLLYKFDANGNFEKEISLNEIFSDGIKGYEIGLIKAVRENTLPIYSRWIYSKNNFDSLYISENIPFAEFDVIDQDFNRDFDVKFRNQEKFKSKCIIDRTLRLEVEKDKDVVQLQSFYPSGNKKSFKKAKDGKPFELTCEWFENGHLSIKNELLDGYSNYIRTTYYEDNGNDYIRISRIDGNKTYDRWFKNGQREVEYLENIGYVYYNEKGEKVRLVEDGGKTTIYNNV